MTATSPTTRNPGKPDIAAFFLLAGALALMAGCATTPTADIRVDQDRTADFASYRTYGFPEELGTDRAGYSTLVTTYFKSAVNREMQARGYRYVENDPDLLVNFFANVRDVVTTRRRPNTWVSYGYYGYRYGLYSAWPLYADGVDTVQYRVGTANIDIVDAERDQLVWEGVAEGRLTRDVMENPRPAIDAVVEELFTRYPGRAPGAPP